MIWFYLVSFIFYIINYWIAKNLREYGKPIFPRVAAVVVILLALIPLIGTIIMVVIFFILLSLLFFEDGITWKDKKKSKVKEWFIKPL